MFGSKINVYTEWGDTMLYLLDSLPHLGKAKEITLELDNWDH